MKLKPAVSYQGSKTRLAEDIINTIDPPEGYPFYDLCCGNGSISIELIRRGVRPNRITMVDSSPWGNVWNLIGKGEFSIRKLSWWLGQIPDDKRQVKGFMEELSQQDATVDTPYVFLLLQAASFGSKAIWREGKVWKNTSFRSYWEPTPTSSRRYPVNPMMPMPDTLRKRMGVIAEKMEGVSGLCSYIEDLVPRRAVVYIDPPYENTTNYGDEVKDVVKYATNVAGYGNTVYVSESGPLPQSDEAYMLKGKRDKGGISGRRKKKNEEWLSVYHTKVLL